MFSYKLFSKSARYFTFFALTSCSPFSNEPAEKSIVELEFNDSTIQEYTQESHQTVVANLAIEIQENATFKRKTLFMRASFFRPEFKNPLFPDIPTELLKNNIFETRPDAQPCGIPGYQDCPSLVHNNQSTLEY